jgi:hypothetical protein
MLGDGEERARLLRDAGVCPESHLAATSLSQRANF